MNKIGNSLVSQTFTKLMTQNTRIESILKLFFGHVTNSDTKIHPKNLFSDDCSTIWYKKNPQEVIFTKKMEKKRLYNTF